VSQEPADRPGGVLPGGDPDDVAEESTPGSEGDGPEESYTEPGSPEQGTDEGTTEGAEGR
jgi:hypothetical protein